MGQALDRIHDTWSYLWLSNRMSEGTLRVYDMYLGAMADVHFAITGDPNGRLHVWADTFNLNLDGIVWVLCHELAHVKTNKPHDSPEFQASVSACFNG